jgi:bacteriocin-like protein
MLNQGCKQIFLEDHMNDEIQKETTVNAKPGEELSTEELSNINGGVVKKIDVSSAQLFLKCATADHGGTSTTK